MQEKTRLLKLSELNKVADMDRRLFGDPWNPATFRQYLENNACQIIGTFRGRELLGYVCVALYGRRLAVERLCVNDGDDDDPATADLVSAMKQLLPISGKVRIEIEVELEDIDTIMLFKSAGFVARPWLSGRYVHREDDKVRLCYLPSVPPPL